MKTVEMASSMLEQAAHRLKTVKMAVKVRGYAYAVRSAQECVELSLKAALRLVGVEYPKKHDVSRALVATKEKFPNWFEVEKLAKISRELAEKREPAMYGDELRLVPSTVLFDKKQALKALEEAEMVYRVCVKLLKMVVLK